MRILLAKDECRLAGGQERRRLDHRNVLLAAFGLAASMLHAGLIHAQSPSTSAPPLLFEATTTPEVATFARPAAESLGLPTCGAGDMAPVPRSRELDLELADNGFLVGEVRIRVGDIFDREDPKENKAAYRMVDRLHRSTRRAVVKRLLLFHLGDPYSGPLLDETERLLRAGRMFHEVEIRPICLVGRSVTVDVFARDVWTLSAGLSFGREGGANTTSFSLRDTNFFGTGKSVTIEQRYGVDRDESLVHYSDPALLGSRLELSFDYGQASDGGGWNFRVERPFFALSTKWSLGFGGVHQDQIDSRYTLGEISDSFAHVRRRFEASGGRSRGLHDGRVVRWFVGFTYEADTFSTAPGGRPEAPPERAFSYPWLGWEWQKPRFEETENLNVMGKTEDVSLGPRVFARIGYSLPALGAERSAILFDGAGSYGVRPSPRRLAVFHLSSEARREDSVLTNASLAGAASLFSRNLGDNEFFVSLSGALAKNLDPERQVLLGGDSGLRGYPLRFQEGTSKILLTVEQRYFTNWYPFRLVRIGAAAFVDVGRTWGGPSAADLGWLSDIGVGLRVIPTRSARASVIHLDLAMPLSGAQGISGLQFVVKSKSRF